MPQPDRPARDPRRPGSPASLALVVVGGACGVTLRHLAGLRWPDPETGFAWTTWTINGLGSLALAFLVIGLVRTGGAWWLRPALGTGLIGGFTTFSAVTHLAALTVRDGSPTAALIYLLASVTVGVVGAVLGVALGSRWALHRA